MPQTEEISLQDLRTGRWLLQCKATCACTCCSIVNQGHYGGRLADSHHYRAVADVEIVDAGAGFAWLLHVISDQGYHHGIAA